MSHVIDEIDGVPIKASSGNIYADFNMADSEERLLRARLARLLANIITARGLTQGQAAELLQTTQPRISDLMSGRASKFSLEKLVHYARLLGKDVKLSLQDHATPAEEGKLELVTA